MAKLTPHKSPRTTLIDVRINQQTVELKVDRRLVRVLARIGVTLIFALMPLIVKLARTYLLPLSR